MTRLGTLGTSLGLALGFPAAAAELPLSGEAVAGMSEVDATYIAFMERREIPGGSVAIMKDGRVVYARGFGWADLEERKPVKPETLFRIASISKPVTALAVAALVEEGAMDYDQKVFPYLGYPTPDYPGAERDPRLDSITVLHLLQHSGGWDRDTALDPEGKPGFDPMFYPNQASRDLAGREQPPATPEQVARWMVGKPLQFDPGTRYAYSNLGYCILGRMIEIASGEGYESYLRKLLAPAKITSMRIGRGRRAALRENETRYHPFSGCKLGRSVWGEEDVKAPYRYSISTMDAHGGWIATATDLVRFTTLLDGHLHPADAIGPDTLSLISKRPRFSPRSGGKNYYGLGWAFWENDEGDFRNWFHSGSLPGTMSMLIRSDNRITWAALFNRRPREADAAFQDFDATMWRAIRSVTQWPE